METADSIDLKFSSNFRNLAGLSMGVLDLKSKGCTSMTHTASIVSALLAAGLIAHSNPVFAADAATVPANTPPTPPPAAAVVATQPDVPPVSPDSIATLKVFKDQGADINYLGRKYGLDGWLVSKGNAIQVLYTTADGQGTVVGLLYGPDGNIVTGSQLLIAKSKGLNLEHTTSALNNIGTANTSQTSPANPAMPSLPPSGVATPAEVAASTRAGTTPATPQASAPPVVAPANPSSPSEQLWAQTVASTYITFGLPKAAPLYVFMDPTCHYCHDYFNALMSAYVPQGSVQLRVIPVGILSEKSKQEALQIMSAVDPAAAWNSAETGDLSSLPPTPANGVAQKIDANQHLMSEWKFRGTPGSIYRGKDGKVRVVYGLPENLPQVIGDLAQTDH